MVTYHGFLICKIGFRGNISVMQKFHHMLFLKNRYYLNFQKKKNVNKKKVDDHSTGHSTHFKGGGDSPKVDGGILQNKAVFYFHFDIFIFENKVAREKLQLYIHFSQCSAAVECPDLSCISSI